MWKSVKNWFQEWVFNIYKRKLGGSRWIAYFENYLQKWFGDRYGEFPTAFPTRFSCKIFLQDFLQDFPTRFSHKIFPQDFPARFSHKIFPQDFPTRFSHKIFPQDFPARFSHKIFLSWILIGWLPITLFQMLNFHQSLPFLNWLFPSSLSCKNFPQDFPIRFSKAGSWLVGSPSSYSKC